MVTRTLPDYEGKHAHPPRPRTSNISSNRATTKSVQSVTPRSPLPDQSRNSTSRAHSVQESAIDTPRSHSGKLEGDHEVEDESLRPFPLQSTALPSSVIKFERRCSLESNPQDDVPRNTDNGSEAFQRGRSKKRFSFAVGRNAAQGPITETWQIFVDEEKMQEAAQLVEQDQTAYDPDQYDLQSIVAALFDRNAALRQEIVSFKADDAAAKRQRALRHRQLLSVKMPGMLDKYNYESEEEDEGLEEILSKDPAYNVRWDEARQNQHPSKVHYNEQSKNIQDPALDDTVPDPPIAGSREFDAQRSIKVLLDKHVEHRQNPQPDPEAPATQPDAIRGGSSFENVQRMAELEKKLDDLTKRHNMFRQENSELKKKTRDIQAERDKFKFEMFRLQRTRSDAQYEKLREQYQELQIQTQQLLRQRQELLDMSKNMVAKLPEYRKTQTNNLRAHQMYWENERVRAHMQKLGQITEEGSSSSIDTLKALKQNRTGPVQHAEPRQDSTLETEKEDLSDVQSGPVPADKTEVAIANGIALRSRQGSTAPVDPGKGLEESRKNGPKPLKQRPGSIVRPVKNVQGLPRVTTKPPSYHLYNPEHSQVAQSLKPSSSSTGIDSTTSADYSGDSYAVNTANQLHYARIMSQIHSTTPGSFAWRDVADPNVEHQNSPLSGLTPFFEMVEDPPLAFHQTGFIRYDIRGPDTSHKPYKFRKGERILVYVDGMHDFWPVKVSESQRKDVYILPRNAIALTCDHGQEYTEDTYEVTRSWPEEPSPINESNLNRRRSRPSEFPSVEPGERFHNAHICRQKPVNVDELQNYHCVISLNGRKKGFVPSKVLLELKSFRAPPLTASLCPCANPKPYAGRARVLVDCGEPSGQLNLKEGAEVEISHLDTNLGAFCVRDTETKNQGFIDAICLRLMRNAVHPNPEYGEGNTALELTPRFFDVENKDLKAMEVTQGDVKRALNQRRLFDNMSNMAIQRWNQNLDGTNPRHKNYKEEMSKARPVWTRWKGSGLPSSDNYQIHKADLEALKRYPKWKDSALKDMKSKNFIHTYPFHPLGPARGIYRARSRSVPALRDPAYLNKQEQARELLTKNGPHIGHQPHRKLADGDCPDRDYMSEPITGEPPDLKRRYIYFKDDGTMLACEAATETNAYDHPMWMNPKYRRSGTNFLAPKHRGILHLMPVEETVDPFSFDNVVPNSWETFGYVQEAPRSEDTKVEFDAVDIFHDHQRHGFNLVYRLKNDPRTIPLLALNVFTADDRFEIIELPAPEMRSVEGYSPTITIRRAKRRLHTESSQSIDAHQDENEFLNDAMEDGKHIISPSELDPTPFLRTAFMKDEPMPEYLMPLEREKFRFVLLRKPIQGLAWDSLFEGRILPTKLSMMELEDVKLWKPLTSVLDQIQLAYRQKEVMDALEKEEKTVREADPTLPHPQIEHWDFWYPVIQEHIGVEDGFINIAGPSLTTGQPVEYVKLMATSEDTGAHEYNTFFGNKTGLVHAGAVNLKAPHLPKIPLPESSGTLPDAYIVALKEENNMFFISSSEHAKGWIDPEDLSFDSEVVRLLPLRSLFQEHFLNVDNFEGSEAYLNDVYDGESAENEPHHTEIVTSSKPLFAHDASTTSTFQEMASTSPRKNLGHRLLLSDSPGPPLSLYCPKPAREATSVSAAANANTTRSQEQHALIPPSNDIDQITRKTLPRDGVVMRTGSRDRVQISGENTSTSANNSSMSMIELHLLGTGGTPQAPEIPVETKPIQHPKKITSSATNSEDGRDLTEPEIGDAEAEPNVVKPHDENEFVIRYDDWIKREEAFKDNTSTNTGKSSSTRIRESCNLVHDVTGQSAETGLDAAVKIGHASVQSTSSNDVTYANHLPQCSVRADNSNKRRESKSRRGSKRRRSESDQCIEHGLKSFSKRTRSTARGTSDEVSKREATTSKAAVGQERNGLSRRPSELAEQTICGSHGLFVDACEIPINHSPVFSHHEVLGIMADVTSTRFPSLYGIRFSTSPHRDRFKTDQPHIPGNAEESPRRGTPVPGSRWTSIFEGKSRPNSPRRGWSGCGETQTSNTHNASEKVHPSPSRVTAHLGDGLELSILTARITKDTRSTSTTPQVSMDSNDSGVKLDPQEDEEIHIATSSNVTEIGDSTNGAHITKSLSRPTGISMSKTHPDHVELPGSPVSPTRSRHASITNLPQLRRSTLTTVPARTTANIPPIKPRPRSRQTSTRPHPRQSLALLPVRSTPLIISPIHTPTFSDLDPNLQWIHLRLTFLMYLFLNFNNTRSMGSEPNVSMSIPGMGTMMEMGAGTGTGMKLGKPSRWMMLYLLVLGYLLFSIWLARGEWMDANGMGGVWGVSSVRGGYGRWVWGVHMG